MRVRISANIAEAFHGQHDQKSHGGGWISTRELTRRERDTGPKLHALQDSKSKRAFARTKEFDDLRSKGFAVRTVTGNAKLTPKGLVTMRRYDNEIRKESRARKLKQAQES